MIKNIRRYDAISEKMRKFALLNKIFILNKLPFNQDL